MYLSKISLLGFKSFPFKTEIILDSGMTAIVGPNGCGKTNILDAIRWVLGEQKTSVLRGERMEEVIFNGTKELKPLGMAEVSLTIQNQSRILPVEYSEVEITRRYFRSNESEFYLNKVPCRLKDIVDLFLDTGAGAHSYSMIQQEMIDSLLSPNAEERRFLFEEAAGISKYKKKRKETQRKLLATENDILRIKDVIAEVQRQVNSLKRQAHKAKRFKELKDDLKKMELILYEDKYKGLSFSLDGIDQKLKEKDGEKDNIGKKIEEKDEKLNTLKAELLQKEKELSTFQEKELFLSESFQQLETEILLKKDQMKNIEGLVNKSDKEAENLNLKILSVEEEIKKKGKELFLCSEKTEKKKNESEKIERELELKQGELQKAKAEFEKLSFQLEEKEESLQSSEYEFKIQKNELEQKEKLIGDLSEKKKKLEAELKQIQIDLGELSSFNQEKKDCLEEEKVAISAVQNEFDSLLEDLVNLSTEKIKLESELKSKRSEQEIWDELLLTYEGYGSGTKAIFENKQNLSGIIDSVANLVKTKKEHLCAIEQVLGEALNYILCEDEKSAKDAIEFLKEKKAGKATFIIQKRLKEKETASRRPDLATVLGYDLKQNIIGWANDLILCDPAYKPLFDLLLGEVLVVSDLDNSFEKISFSDVLADYDLVSLEGEVIRKGYILEGGQREEKSLLGRKDKIDSLKQKIQKIEDDLQKTNSEIQRLSDKKEKFELELKNKDAKIEELKHSKEKIDEDFKRLTLKKDMLSSELTGIKSSEDEHIKRMHQFSQEVEAKEGKFTKLSGEKNNLVTRVQESRKNLDDLEKRQQENYKKLNDLRFETVSLGGKEENLRIEGRRLSEVKDELEALFSDRKKEKNDFLAKLGELKNTMEEKEKRKEELSGKRELQKKIVESKDGLKKGLLDKVTENEGGLKSLREKKEQVSEQMHKLQLEKLTVSSEIQRLKEKAWEEYQVELESFSLPQSEEKKDTELRRDEVQVVKEKLERIGTVNLLALEEYESQKNRLDFLTSQLDDLLSAEKSLKEAIVMINKTAKRLFLETFDQIKGNFQKVFTQLFEGGEAGLVLKDGDDPLEAFIDITANPKGKALLNLNQLSGGEKALTAISLLFAIYLVKPSPFCILDEVDAPLDDSNLLRFIKLLQNFSKNTQFIIITHNKLTMEAADVLYGVTMEKSGVSKIVSVKLKKEEITT